VPDSARCAELGVSIVVSLSGLVLTGSRARKLCQEWTPQEETR